MSGRVSALWCRSHPFQHAWESRMPHHPKCAVVAHFCCCYCCCCCIKLCMRCCFFVQWVIVTAFMTNPRLRCLSYLFSLISPFRGGTLACLGCRRASAWLLSWGSSRISRTRGHREYQRHNKVWTRVSLVPENVRLVGLVPLFAPQCLANLVVLCTCNRAPMRSLCSTSVFFFPFCIDFVYLRNLVQIWVLLVSAASSLFHVLWSNFHVHCLLELPGRAYWPVCFTPCSEAGASQIREIFDAKAVLP